MCITAFGHAQYEGRFRLGKRGEETALRLDCVNGRSLAEDPIYQQIDETARGLSPRFTDSGETFSDPFTASSLDALGQASLMVTHPTGGAIIGPASVATRADDDGRLVFDPERRRGGVVDEFGRVCDVARTDPQRPYYEGLYVADVAILPTSVGVNPSITISALALRVADKIIEENYRGP